MATVLGTVTDLLTYKTLGRAGTLISLNGDFRIKQTVYLKDFFKVFRLGDVNKIDWEVYQGIRHIDRV